MGCKVEIIELNIEAAIRDGYITKLFVSLRERRCIIILKLGHTTTSPYQYMLRRNYTIEYIHCLIYHQQIS